jgi:hypothetical protein
LRPMTIVEMPAKAGAKATKAGMKAVKQSAAGRRRLAQAHESLFKKLAAGLIQREREAIMVAAETAFGAKAQADFDAAVAAFYGDDYAQEVERQVMPALLAYGEAMQKAAAAEVGTEAGMTPALEAFISAYAAAFASRWIGSSRGQVLSVAGDAVRSGGDPVAALAARFDEWEEKRPGKTALWETRQAGNAVAKETYRLAGIRKLAWAASSGACPYCSALDGKTVEIEKVFLNAGDPFRPGGAGEPLVTQTSLGHPPAHDGCDCSVVPA